MIVESTPAIKEDEFVVAQRKFANGQALNQGDEKILDRVLGNNDGAFNQKDRDKMQADREDTAFLNRSRINVCAAVEYGVMSAGAGDAISAPGIANQFEAAAQGMNIGPQNAPQFAPNSPGFANNPNMNLALNKFAPAGPTSAMGFGGL